MQLMSDTVLRVIPNQSLAEDALQDAVERLEEQVGRLMELLEVPVAESTHAPLARDHPRTRPRAVQKVSRIPITNDAR